MTLIVSVYIMDGSGALVEDQALGGFLSAGFEDWRTEVWGSLQVRALGAEYFPRLAEADLYVGAWEMAAFLRECALLRAHLDAITAPLDLSRLPVRIVIGTATGSATLVPGSRGLFREQASVRLANIEAAARRALEIGGDVLVWLAPASKSRPAQIAKLCMASGSAAVSCWNTQIGGNALLAAILS